jgi:hypothetical protein
MGDSAGLTIPCESVLFFDYIQRMLRFDTEQSNEPRIELIYGNRAEFHFEIMEQQINDIPDGCP